MKGGEGRGTPRTGGDGGTGDTTDGRGRRRGTPWTGGDGAGAAEMAVERVRLAEDADARGHVCADRSISGVAREPHTLNHLEGPPGRQQSLRELAQESAFSNNFSKWIPSLGLTEGRWGGALECQSFPGRGGPPPGAAARAWDSEHSLC